MVSWMQGEREQFLFYLCVRFPEVVGDSDLPVFLGAMKVGAAHSEASAGWRTSS